MNREDQLYVLKWMLDFVKVDIDKLRPKEMVSLLMELDAALSGVLGDRNKRIAFPYITWRASKDSPETFIPKKIKQARRLQEHMRSFLQDTFRKIKKARESEDQWLEIKEFEDLFYLSEVGVKEATLQAVIEADHDMLPDEEGDYADVTSVARWPAGSLSNAIIKISRRLPDDENGLSYYFLEALDGLPLKRLQECSECGSWFVSPDERKRIYCSSSCLKRKTNSNYQTKIKEEDPDTYEAKLAEKREKEHKRYEKKQEPKLAPGGKVQRRPRKPRPKED